MPHSICIQDSISLCVVFIMFSLNFIFVTARLLVCWENAWVLCECAAVMWVLECCVNACVLCECACVLCECECAWVLCECVNACVLWECAASAARQCLRAVRMFACCTVLLYFVSTVLWWLDCTLMLTYMNITYSSNIHTCKIYMLQ